VASNRRLVHAWNLTSSAENKLAAARVNLARSPGLRSRGLLYRTGGSLASASRRIMRLVRWPIS